MRRVKGSWASRWSKSDSQGSGAKAAADPANGDDLEEALRASLWKAEERFRAQQQRVMEEFLREQRGAIEVLASGLKASRTPEPAEEYRDQEGTTANESLEETNLLSLPSVRIATTDQHNFDVSKSLSEGLKAMQTPMLRSHSLKEVEKERTGIKPRNKVQSVLLPVISSQTWKLTSTLLVLSMCCELGLSAHCKLRAQFEKQSRFAGFIVGWARGNTILFVFELLVELLAQQVDFFCGDNKRWNLFDLVLGAINLAFASNVMSERHFGVLRVFRSLRMLRLLEIFPELRTMLYSICACATSVGWSACLLFSYSWMIAIYLMEASLSYFRDVDWHKDHSELDESMIESLKNNWSSIGSSLLSLTKAVTGGADWGDLAAPFFHMGPWGNLHCAVFLSFIMSTIFVLFNIVVGLIVTKSEEVGSWDRDTALFNAHTRMKEDMNDLSSLFDEFDTGGNGVVSIGEIARGLEKPRIKAFFRHLRIDIIRSDLMMKFFDTDCTGDVDRNEFIRGCLRLQGAAKPAEVAEILTLAQSINKKLNEMTPNEKRPGDKRRPRRWLTTAV